MNILYHFRVRGIGAEGVHIAGIANGFRSWGHEVSFVSPLGTDPTATAKPDPPGQGATTSPTALEASDGGTATGGPAALTGRAMKRLLHVLADKAPQPFFEAMELGYNGLAIPRLLRAGRARQADLLYERYAFFNLAGAAAAGQLGIPFVLEINELAGYERVRDQSFVRVAQAVERAVLRRANLIVTVSEFLTSRAQEIVNGQVPVVTVPNGVSSDWLTTSVSSEDIDRLRHQLGLEGRPVVAFVGGLTHWHNFGLLLEAMAQLKSQLPRAALLIVGDGPCRDFIQAESARLGLEDSVVLAGRVPHDQIASYIGMCDIGVIPETNQYRSPIKMFEYMAAGKAVVAPRMPPVAAVIESERSGLMFDPGSAEHLGQVLLRAFTDRPLAAALGRNARQQIRRGYTWEEHARRILRLAHTRGTPAHLPSRVRLASSR